MKLEDMLDECETLYFLHDYRKLVEQCRDILESHKDNQIAIGYLGVAHVFLNQSEKAAEVLERGLEIYPENYYLKNNLAMAYYDMGEYEKSLECCEEGLEIKNFDWLYENKIKALIRLERIDEAFECWRSAPYDVDLIELLLEAGKHSHALKYCISEDVDDINVAIDKIKIADNREVGDFYISWIHKIKSRTNVRVCPECGGKLIPIEYGYPSAEMMEKAERGEIFLGGCTPYMSNYRCRECGLEFDLGCEGLVIECDDAMMCEYAEYKIRQLTTLLRSDDAVVIKSRKSLKGQLPGFDDRELDEFLDRLIDLDHLCEPRKGFVKLEGYDDFKCIKQYCDEGKYAAPGWLTYPELSAWTIGWRMGYGEDYAMNMPHYGEEFKKLFPMPEYWKFKFRESPHRPHPLIGYFWTPDGKPKYPKFSRGVEVNGFITPEDEGEFRSDTFTFTSIEHAVLLSKFLHFNRCSKTDGVDTLRNLKLNPDEQTEWEVFNYSVILNASYFKVMQDEDLKRKLLETGDEPLVYVCQDEDGLFARALMELRDEIARLCKNEDKIDWAYTEYLKRKSWW